MPRFRLPLAAAASLLLAAGALAPAAVHAAPCRDAKGKFVACPPPKKAACRDAKGKFIKCADTAAPGGATH